VTNLRARDLVRFSLRLEPSILTIEQTEQWKPAPLKSTTEFGFGNVRHRHQKDQNLAKAERRKKDHIAILSYLLAVAGPCTDHSDQRTLPTKLYHQTHEH